MTSVYAEGWGPARKTYKRRGEVLTAPTDRTRRVIVMAVVCSYDSG
jgi:hypothetical protein